MGCRTDARLAQSQPPSSKGFRGVDCERQSLGLHRLCAAAHQEISLILTQCFFDIIQLFRFRFRHLAYERHRRKRRDIRQMIIQEMSYSAKAMTTRQISKAIDYLQEGTEMALNRLENEGKIAQSPDGFWEIVVGTGVPPQSLTVAA